MPHNQSNPENGLPGESNSPWPPVETGSINDLVDESKTYNPDAIRAVKRFALSRPWHGDASERTDKFSTVLRELCEVYGMGTINLQTAIDDLAEVGDAAYDSEDNAIILLGKLSVVNLLTMFAYVRGVNKPVSWAINLFRRCFPKSWERADKSGTYLKAG